MDLKRVVVTGLGAVSSNGIGREAYWNATRNGISGTGPITLFDASKLSCRVAAEVKDFDFDRFISKKDKDRVQRAVPMAFYATEEAAADAGIQLESLNERERESIGERTSAAMQHMATEGRYTGGAAPYGYRLTAAGERLEPVEAEQVVVAAAVAARARGLTLR